VSRIDVYFFSIIAAADEKKIVDVFGKNIDNFLGASPG